MALEQISSRTREVELWRVCWREGYGAPAFRRGSGREEICLVSVRVTRGGRGPMPSIGVVAGEASGDIHAANLLKALRRWCPQIEAWAVGGACLREAGAEILFPTEALADMGLAEAARKVPALLRARASVLERFSRAPPDVFVPVDYGGLNLRLAKRAKDRGIRVVYYVPPKVWAWGKWRVKQLKKAVDEALVILPFEEAYLRSRGVSATYVGSPVLDHLKPRRWEPERDVVGLLPGSREGEVSRIWPLLLDAAARLSRDRRIRFLAAKAPGLPRRALEDPLRDRSVRVEILDGRAQEVMERSRLCLVASGTATLECALVGTPLVAVYRVHTLTYAVARRLVRSPFITLPNLIAGQAIVPELIQTDSEAVAKAAEPLWEEGPERKAMVRGLAGVRQALGRAGASERAALRVWSHLFHATTE